MWLVSLTNLRKEKIKVSIMPLNIMLNLTVYTNWRIFFSSLEPCFDTSNLIYFFIFWHVIY